MRSSAFFCFLSGRITHYAAGVFCLMLFAGAIVVAEDLHASSHQRRPSLHCLRVLSLLA